MAYNHYKIGLMFRLAILFLALTALAYGVNKANLYFIIPALAFIIIYTFQLYKYLIKPFDEINDFFETIKYKDFSRWFNDKSGPKDIRELHKGFNDVTKTIKQINSDKEAQHLYLLKILEMVDTGIISYNTLSGEVLWVNTAFTELLNVPTFKKINFIKSRKPKLFKEIFEKHHDETEPTTLNIENEKIKVLILSSIFTIDENTFQLIAIQNIDNTINQAETDAWKKLLSVMTHEIMNSIAPISSLAETLQNNVQLSISNPKDNKLDITDLDAGIESIKKRSEGLMMFAKTYRNLNKITHLNLSSVSIHKFFENIKNLMLPTLKHKSIELNFQIEQIDLQIDIDAYLIEQVLINLILNAIDACEGQKNAKIVVTANKNMKGNVVIQVSDNGKGISEDLLDKIFVPFFTTKKNGSGIGLSLCKQIMLLHKGKIQITSEENKHTVVSLIF